MARLGLFNQVVCLAAFVVGQFDDMETTGGTYRICYVAPIHLWNNAGEDRRQLIG